MSTTTTYTEEQLQAAVAKAVNDATADLRQKLETFEAKANEDETEQKVAAARSELETELADVRRQLDEQVLAAQAAQARVTEIETWLADEAAKAEREAQVAARREERVATVKAAAAFPDDYVAANAERWAAMDDEAFATYVDDLKVVASKGGSTVPTGTAMTASRDESGSITGRIGSALQAVRELRAAGADPRTL